MKWLFESEPAVQRGRRLTRRNSRGKWRIVAGSTVILKGNIIEIMKTSTYTLHSAEQESGGVWNLMALFSITQMTLRSGG